MESPTLWKGLMYVIRHWKTFGIHFLIKALEDGAKEWITCQSAQANCPLKQFLPIPRYSRGWFCPKAQIMEAGIQPANQMARIHWACLWCGAFKGPGSLPVDIYSNLLGGWRRGNTKLLIGHQSGSHLKNIGSIIAFGLPSGGGCNPCGSYFQFLIFFFQ